MGIDAFSESQGRGKPFGRHEKMHTSDLWACPWQGLIMTLERNFSGGYEVCVALKGGKFALKIRSRVSFFSLSCCQALSMYTQGWTVHVQGKGFFLVCVLYPACFQSVAFKITFYVICSIVCVWERERDVH